MKPREKRLNSKVCLKGQGGRKTSRGGWVIIIGGVILLVGIGLLAFLISGLVSTFAPDRTTLAVDAFQNRTLEVQEIASALTYVVGIEGFTPGHQLTVFIQTPSGGEAQRMTVEAETLTKTYEAAETGAHTLVIQNTGSQSAVVLHAASVVDAGTASLIAVGGILAFGGFIILIIGLVLWIIDRGRARRAQQTGMPPLPPTSPP